MEELIKYLDEIKIPQADDKIYKDECVYSFDTPESSAGLYVSLTSFHGLGQDHVERYSEKTGRHVFLNIMRTKKALCETAVDGPAKKITRLAIGEPGGFTPNDEKFSIDEMYKIVILPNFTTVPYPCNDLPEKIKNAVTGILEAESATKVAEREALTGTWDGEAKVISKHASNLLQLDNGRKILPTGWKCDKCDLTQNLWLNLTDGTILCGRKFYDGTGGNDHAVEHYQTTGYPLAVKLGTITKEGKGDIYSYDEDDMVEDPNLVAHLAHWGINIAQLEKTEKSMVELELDLNQKFGEWVALQEAASKLTPIYGPGYTGLTNLGNSCYLNSVMQTIFTIPNFVKRFVDPAVDIFNANTNDPANDFNVQMAKLGSGLLSGKYSIKPSTDEGDQGRQGIAPRMFKNLIGRGHPGFSSTRQQDSQEFFLHLLNLLDRHSVHRVNPADCFKFQVEDRFECGSSGQVKYSRRPEYLLPLPIPLDAATNKDDLEAYETEKREAQVIGTRRTDSSTIVRPHIKLASCLETFARTELIEQFYSTAINDKTTAKKTTRLATFPDYLLLHLKKFTVNPDWTMVKLDVAVDMPDELDLNILRGFGLQPNEELLPECASEIPAPVYDQTILNQLLDMGFPMEACKRSLYFTENRGLEAATNWLIEHVTDTDFAEKFIPPGADRESAQASFVPNSAGLEYLSSLGFTRANAIKALKATENNTERAVDWICCHQSELDIIEMEDEITGNQTDSRDDSTRYKLVGFISHMGTSSMVGHYVCHLLKNDQWVIFNDEKVALSENPPKELGYIYMYQRINE